MSALTTHLATGNTTVCRCWALTRADGVVLGFTDHDRTLTFDGISFRAETGLSARALEQTTGLAIDNTEAVGVLTSDTLDEAEIEAGRFDGAEVVAWQVNWAAPAEREVLFRGQLGEIVRAGPAFRAELRGLAEVLNQPQGRVYQKPCSAVLGDGECRFDLDQPGFAAEVQVATVEDRQTFVFAGLDAFAARWFENGVLRVLDGAGVGLRGIIRSDVSNNGLRRMAVLEPLRAEVVAGDVIRLEPGCDKRAATCQGKFDNFTNFRGFPSIPGDDWQLSYPRQGGQNDGGSLGS
ncbi:MAG: DUF2163 domain-containing protein [Pseudomonadota bacterium]